MGKCTVNSVDLPDGSSSSTGVLFPFPFLHGLSARNLITKKFRCSWKGASTWRRVNALGFVSTLASCQLRWVDGNLKNFAGYHIQMTSFKGTNDGISNVLRVKFKFAMGGKFSAHLISDNPLMQAFFKKYMGVPLLMEPNFQDYSCQVISSLLVSFSLKHGNVIKGEEISIYNTLEIMNHLFNL